MIRIQQAGRMWARDLGAIAIGMVLGCTQVLAGPPESAPGAAKANPRAFPEVNLPDKANREAAIAGLGDKLPEVAAWYGMSPAEFVRMLREDGTAWIDVRGRLFYIDDFSDPAGESQASSPLQAAPFLLSETFFLNSRPGSNRVIYLDFDGHTTTGTWWNSSYSIATINSPAYDIDSNPAFSNTELEYIQNMWRQVAEDFAPFDVNVTTQDPGDAAINRSSSGDLTFGTRVIITEDNFAGCGCGGFAYLRSFDDTHDSGKPAFVFNSSLVGAGEAITHEVGHNLGLSHDGVDGGTDYYRGHGSGPTGWAPIMGVGYYELLVQWSKGEYSGANQQQDDINLIDFYGAPLMTDDHGNTSTSSTPLGATAGGGTVSLSGSGLIHLRSDVDVFSFTAGAGTYSISVDPAPFSPNLDIEARLLNSSGGEVDSSNPTDSLPASLSGSLSAGEYFLVVDGVGKGDPLGTGYTDYGSLGRYSISGSAVEPNIGDPPVAVADDLGYSDLPQYSSANIDFSGSGSYDPDPEGSIVDHEWDFGEGGATVHGESVSNLYDAPGDYTVTLTVRDNDGLSDSDSLTITVLNQSPVAVASASPDNGEAPLQVQFNGSGSSDPDAGSSLSHSWTFGDGGTSGQADPLYTYNGVGSFTAVLTVTDNLGAEDMASVGVEVTVPPFTDHFASGEEFGAGTVSGNYVDTHDFGSNTQSIRERESGGRKRNRYSYLLHTWVFDLPGGTSTLSLTGSKTDSSDGDQMEFAYSVNGGGYTPLSSINLGTSSSTIAGIALPETGGGGTVRIRVTDSDDTPGNRSLDTVYIDQMYVHTENDGGEPATPPLSASNLSATAVSHSQIDLTWNANSDDETGFRIQRSPDGASWPDLVTVGAGQTSYSDTGLNELTTYHYRVVAYNSGGDADPSDPDNATTLEAPEPPDIILTANGYKVKGRQHVSLSWEGITGNADIYRDNMSSPLYENVSGDTDDDDIGKKGGGSYVYKVCAVGSSSDCSPQENVVF